MKYTNAALGPRGINLKNGETLFLEPGQSAELGADNVGHAHDDIHVGESAELGADNVAPIPLEKLNKTKLLEIVAAEEVTVADGATNAELIKAITEKREAGATA